MDHFHGHAAVSRQMAQDILERLRFDNDTIRKVTRLVLYHDYGNGVDPADSAVRRGIFKIGEDLFPLFLMVRQADLDAQSAYRKKEKQKNLDGWKTKYHEIQARQDCVSLKTLAVTGNDLIALGVPRGRRIGEILNCLLDDVLQNPEDNVHEYLIERAKKLL